MQAKKKSSRTKALFDNQIPLMTCAELAKKLNMSVGALRIRVCRGTIPAIKVGGSLRFDVAEVAKRLEPK